MTGNESTLFIDIFIFIFIYVFPLHTSSVVLHLAQPIKGGLMSKVKKQRGFTADDQEWEAIKLASVKKGFTTTTSYMREVLMNQVKKDLKK